MPIASPFVRLAGFWVDDALSFAMGWNYFFLMGKITQFSHHLFGFQVLSDANFLNESL